MKGFLYTLLNLCELLKLKVVLPSYFSIGTNEHIWLARYSSICFSHSSFDLFISLSVKLSNSEKMKNVICLNKRAPVNKYKSSLMQSKYHYLYDFFFPLLQVPKKKSDMMIWRWFLVDSSCKYFCIATSRNYWKIDVCLISF